MKSQGDFKIRTIFKSVGSLNNNTVCYEKGIINLAKAERYKNITSIAFRSTSYLPHLILLWFWAFGFANSRLGSNVTLHLTISTHPNSLQSFFVSFGLAGLPRRVTWGVSGAKYNIEFNHNCLVLFPTAWNWPDKGFFMGQPEGIQQIDTPQIPQDCQNSTACLCSSHW